MTNSNTAADGSTDVEHNGQTLSMPTNIELEMPGLGQKTGAD